MFRAATGAVLLILGFLFLNLVCGYALDYPCIFPMLVFWLWGTLLICGIYSRGVGDVS
jgi:ABC-type multidrug transport system permease subunit